MKITVSSDQGTVWLTHHIDTEKIAKAVTSMKRTPGRLRATQAINDASIEVAGLIGDEISAAILRHWKGGKQT